jgi:hypothetical protein
MNGINSGFNRYSYQMRLSKVFLKSHGTHLRAPHFWSIRQAAVRQRQWVRDSGQSGTREGGGQGEMKKEVGFHRLKSHPTASPGHRQEITSRPFSPMNP